MSATEQTPTTLGFRAVRGGAVVVAVAGTGAAPRLAFSGFLATAEEGDRLAFEPYHVAVEIARGGQGDALSEARAAVAEGRRRQDTLAAGGVSGLLARLREAGCEPTGAALLVNRAGWLTEELRLPHSLSAPEHPPVIEGLAVRDALRFACGRHHLPMREVDEKTLPDLASAALGVSQGEIDRRLRDLGAAAGRPWRKEQKLAALAAWLTLATP